MRIASVPCRLVHVRVRPRRGLFNAHRVFITRDFGAYRHWKLPNVTLPQFVDDRCPPPEPRVTAFLLDRTIDLAHLHSRLQEFGCPTFLWQGQLLVCGSSVGIGQQRCSAVFLQDGSAICWHMSRATEKLILDVVAESPPSRERLRPEHWPIPQTAPQSLLGTEELDVVEETSGASCGLDPYDGVIRLSPGSEDYTSHILGLSLGLAVVVRLEALEDHIDHRIETYRNDMQREMQWHVLSLSAVSDRIFVAEQGLHALRYSLNSDAGPLDVPDFVWEHAPAERYYDQVIAHFDVKRRTTFLNERLSYSLQHLQTLNEHVRHCHSARLEKMIIWLIFVELCLGVVGHVERRAADSYSDLIDEGLT